MAYYVKEVESPILNRLGIRNFVLVDDKPGGNCEEEAMQNEASARVPLYWPEATAWRAKLDYQKIAPGVWHIKASYLNMFERKGV